MTEKILGYMLIVVGIIAIVYSSVSVYDVFTKKAKPANLFSFSGISMDPSQFLAGNLPPGVTLPKGPAMEIMTPEMINDTSNIFAHVVLMGFIASAGLKLATIGTQLVRTIHVKVKTKDDTISA
jgi:hypothetical protein